MVRGGILITHGESPLCDTQLAAISSRGGGFYTRMSLTSSLTAFGVSTT